MYIPMKHGVSCGLRSRHLGYKIHSSCMHLKCWNLQCGDDSSFSRDVIVTNI